jgi:hypothetical protein
MINSETLWSGMKALQSIAQLAILNTRSETHLFTS